MFWFAALMMICCALGVGMRRRGRLPFGSPGHPALPPPHPRHLAERSHPKMDSGVDQRMDHSQSSSEVTDPVEALQQEYVEGRITAEAYERELDAIFRGD